MTTRVATILRPAAAATALTRVRAAMTALNLHLAGVAVLAILNLYLLVHMGIAWQTAHSQNADALANQRVQLKLAEIAAQPLDGLDAKLVRSTVEADKFYDQRLPFAFSQVLSELGALAKKENVKLTRVQYATPKPLLDEGLESGIAVNEIRMDASLNGDYRPLVEFINLLERDKLFFLVSGVTLTGQQSGVVGLRLRVTTYLRSPHGAERGEALPQAGVTGDAAQTDTAQGDAQPQPKQRGVPR